MYNVYIFIPEIYKYPKYQNIKNKNNIIVEYKYN